MRFGQLRLPIFVSEYNHTLLLLDLLLCFVKNSGIALTREKILNKIWGNNYFGDDRTLDTHIRLLRKSLGEYGKCIVTLRGVGYRFDAEDALS